MPNINNFKLRTMTKEEAKKILREVHENSVFSVRTALETFLPELKESNNERIRKGITILVNDWWDRVATNNMSSREEMLAYLEKVKDFDEQLEQAYKNSDEVQYKRGYDDGYVEGMAFAKQELEKQAAIKDGNSIDPHFGKHIITDCGAKEKIQEKIIELSQKEDQEWNEDDEKNLQGVIDEIQANKSSAPEYDLKTYDRFLSWLKSIKQRLQ